MAYLRNIVCRGSKTTQFGWRQFSRALAFSEEVQDAKVSGKPLVALESTIITHGMPYPQNLETALAVENIIREKGAVPATVAILKGKLTVGLTKEQIERLAQTTDAVKASRRDLAPVAAARLDGATTVAGTIVAAELADIPIFVTGGIGGVHREGEHTLDVSADLTELGRSSTLVVCSGVKSILDIGKTLEYLETQGVCVCAFGASDDFPAFYTARSGHRAPYRVPTASDAAKLLAAARALHLASGTVIAVPIPDEYAMDESVIEKAISTALQDAKNKGIHGKNVTPFILAAVAEATGGASLAANIALIKNNAQVGADIAVEFNQLKNADHLANSFNIGFSRGGSTTSRGLHTSSDARPDAPLLVIGGSNVDRTYRVTEQQVKLDGSTHPCLTTTGAGGVARNIAEALWRLRGRRARLLTAVADDADGRYLSEIAPGLMLDGCVIRGARTPTYAAVMDVHGECRLGLGDMALHDHISIDLVNRHMNVLENAPLVILDGNAPQSTIEYVIQHCNRLNKPVFYEPTDRRKAAKAFTKGFRIAYSSPNIAELRAMAQAVQPHLHPTCTNDIKEILELSKILSPMVECLIITMGSKGVIIIKSTDNRKTFSARLYRADSIVGIKNVSGAGDCFASGFLHGILSGLSEASCVSIGFKTAKSALLSINTVPSNFDVSDMINESCYETLL